MTETDALHWKEKSQNKKKLLTQPPRYHITSKLRLSKKTLLVFVIITVFFFIINDLRLILRLTSYDHYPISTQILDRNGKIIYEIYTEKRRTPVKLSELPPYIKQATIAIEDKDFYRHIGFDPRGTIRALYNTAFKRKLEGGSTITQQLVKTSLLSPERTLLRKIRELYIALTIETIYSKDQILELYLNQVPYGGTAYGIEAASQTYFGKPAKDLTVAEATLLAGLPAAPTRFSPFGANPKLAKNRQTAVLRRMVEDKYITQNEAEFASQEALKFRKPEGATGLHFALWVKEQLVEEYGERTVEQGGLRVTTTLDLNLQQEAEQIVKTEVSRLEKQKVRNGAAIVTHPKTGEILAMVGSKDYFAENEDGNVNVVLANRQPGSSIKPLNYALGFLNGKITPATLLLDIPTCFQVAGQALYCPVNYDGNYHGASQVRFALGNSYNIPAVKALALNGLPEFVEFAQSMGLTTLTDPTRYGLSLTLGGGEVKMTDMAVAYGVFANEGVKQPLTSIIEVKNWQGKTLKKTQTTEGDRIIPMEVAFLISHILYDNNARMAAFGASSYLNVSDHPEVSVKTGTTNDMRDNWTIGYTPDVVVATWVGNNDNTRMSGAVSGVSGASPIWNRIIKFTLDKIEAGEIKDLGESSEKHGHSWSKQPENVVGAHICNTSGLTPDSSNPETGCQTRYEYFIDGTQPTEFEMPKKMVHIDKTTGQLANDKTLPENLELTEKQVLVDVLETMLCLECPFPTESTIINPENLTTPATSQ